MTANWTGCCDVYTYNVYKNYHVKNDTDFL